MFGFEMEKLIITIDGPAASGKSTAARLLAERLGASFLDTGAMYRAVTLAAMQAGIDMNDEEKLLAVLDNRKFQFSAQKGKMAVRIDGVDVTEQIRNIEVTANARYIASVPKLREKLVQMQREFAARERKIVTEGRDQGTVAFPNADIKFYLTADTAERARRRQAELQTEGKSESLSARGRLTAEEIKRAIEERDKADENRTTGPLRPADDAIVLDTTNLTIEEVVEKLARFAGASARRADYIENRESRIENQKMRWFRFARWLCKVFCKMFFQIRVAGRENVPEQGPLVLICNHQSYLDPVLCGIFLKRPLYFLARDTLFANPLSGRLLVSVNTIPVRRGSADLTAIKKVISKLKAGYGLCLFPEATRTSDGKIAPFKAGFGLLARRANAAVVPVVIDGAFECWPRGKKMFSPGKKITICYGKCIPAEEAKKITDEELMKNLTEILRRMQAVSRMKSGKKPLEY